MAFFDDYTRALETYAPDHVTLEIVNIIVPGSALNQGETGTFDVRVSNSGPLRLADVTVRIKGRNGVLVKDAGAAAPFVTEFVTGVGQIPLVAAHDGTPVENVGGFSFRAPSGSLPVSDLVEVTLDDYWADLDHMHVSHSNGSSAVKAVHRDRVRAA